MSSFGGFFIDDDEAVRLFREREKPKTTIVDDEITVKERSRRRGRFPLVDTPKTSTADAVKGVQEVTGGLVEGVLGKGTVKRIEEKGLITGISETFSGIGTGALSSGIGGIAESFGVSRQMLLIGAAIVAIIVIIMVIK